MISRRLIVLAGALLVAGCMASPPPEPPPTTASEEAHYAALYPFYAEICAVSQLGKKPGFGAEIASGFGGHALLYLNGVCRKKDTAYPVLEMCDRSFGAKADGVGISVNAHYLNAEWVATEGRDFFFTGGLPPGQALTRDSYRAVQKEAQAKRIYDGVTFHDEVYDGMPAGFTRSEFQYEMSVSTDYAVAFGRNRYCARIPLDRPQMQRIVAYLNRRNEPYRSGAKTFDWNVLTHNCSHINHNALAEADLWNTWPMDRPVLISMFDFPVPKNEFVNAMRRINDFPIEDLEAVYDDEAARTMLQRDDRLPTQPGGIADLGNLIDANDLYDTDSPIIFYDDPLTGRYRRRFAEILTEPRYFRLDDNLEYFAALYRKIEEERRPVEWYLDKRKGMSDKDRNDFRLFYQTYYAYISKQRQEVSRNIAALKAQ